MREKLKETQGITLVALIITIIVLLILAVVTINAVNEGSLFSHANNAATTYSKAQTDENTMISNYLTELSKHDGTKSMSVGEELASLLNEFHSGNADEGRQQEIIVRAAELGYTGEEDEGIFYETSNTEYRMRIYLFNINILFKLNSNTNQFVYIPETETSEYDIARNALDFKKLLNNKFVVANKTVAEISEMSDGELESYITDGVEYIDSIHINKEHDNYIYISVDIGIGCPGYRVYFDETQFTDVNLED